MSCAYIYLMWNIICTGRLNFEMSCYISMDRSQRSTETGRNARGWI